MDIFVGIAIILQKGMKESLIKLFLEMKKTKLFKFFLNFFLKADGTILGWLRSMWGLYLILVIPIGSRYLKKIKIQKPMILGTSKTSKNGQRPYNSS